MDAESIIATHAEGMDGTDDPTSVPQDSVLSSAEQPLTQDCNDSIHDHDNNEMLKDEAELEVVEVDEVAVFQFSKIS